jgi:hypothetical protein
LSFSYLELSGSMMFHLSRVSHQRQLGQQQQQQMKQPHPQQRIIGTQNVSNITAAQNTIMCSRRCCLLNVLGTHRSTTKTGSQPVFRLFELSSTATNAAGGIKQPCHAAATSRNLDRQPFQHISYVLAGLLLLHIMHHF